MLKKISYFVVFFVVTSCGSSEKKQVVKEEITSITETVATEFNIPSPSEQFTLFKLLNLPKNLNLLNSAENASKYKDADKKALNFGVYAADISYLTSYKESSRYMEYFGKMERLGSEIGVSQVFSKELSEQVEKWEQNPDSLFIVSNEVYDRTFSKLVEIEKGKELSLMLIGGWFESLNIILNSAGEYNSKNKVNKLLADQKLVAENLIDFLVDYQDDVVVHSYLDEVAEVLAIFNQMKCSSTKRTVNKQKGKIAIQGGETCVLTEENFTDLKTKVLEVRTKIVN